MRSNLDDQTLLLADHKILRFEIRISLKSKTVDILYVEVFEKTLSRTKMIDYSFERKFYGTYYRLCKNVLRGFNRALRAHKV